MQKPHSEWDVLKELLPKYSSEELNWERISTTLKKLLDANNMDSKGKSLILSSIFGTISVSVLYFAEQEISKLELIPEKFK